MSMTISMTNSKFNVKFNDKFNFKLKKNPSLEIPNFFLPTLKFQNLSFQLLTPNSHLPSPLYIRNFPLIELLCCTICITSAKRGAQLTTLILLDSCFSGIESVTINSNSFEFSIFS